MCPPFVRTRTIFLKKVRTRINSNRPLTRSGDRLTGDAITKSPAPRIISPRRFPPNWIPGCWSRARLRTPVLPLQRRQRSHFSLTRGNPDPRPAGCRRSPEPSDNASAKPSDRVCPRNSSPQPKGGPGCGSATSQPRECADSSAVNHNATRFMKKS